MGIYLSLGSIALRHSIHRDFFGHGVLSCMSTYSRFFILNIEELHDSTRIVYVVRILKIYLRHPFPTQFHPY